MIAKMLTKNFRATEFACRCRRPECDAAEMLPSFMAMLQTLRDNWGKPMSPTSARRCAVWNAKVGGAPDSQHLVGNAADFWFDNTDELQQFELMAEKCGFKGIGTGKHLIHIDARSGFARWTYDNK